MDSGGVINRHDKGKALYFPFRTLTIKGNAKGRFMIDIKSELLAIQKQREQDFISIIELLDFLKKHNPTTDYLDIALFLLIKLEPHDIRKTDEELWGNEAFEMWEEQHGIKTFIMPMNISDKPHPVDTSYFLTALEAVRDDRQGAFWEDGSTAIDYLDAHQKSIFIDRKQIEKILGIDTLDEISLNETYRQEQIINVSMALTKTEEFVKNTDINKSPVGLAERLVMQQQIAELQAQIKEKDKRIAELEAEKQNTKKAEPQPTTENKTQRISQPQRDIFTLLTVKNYPDCQSRNRLFEAINADLRANGITTKDIKYSTLDKLIDENIRTGSPIRSPFPPKQS